MLASRLAWDESLTALIYNQTCVRGRVCTIYHHDTEITAHVTPLDMPLLTNPLRRERSAMRGRLEFITAPHTPGAHAALNVKPVSFTAGCVKVTWQLLLEKMKWWAFGKLQFYLCVHFLKIKLTIRTNRAFTVPQKFMHVKGYSILVQIHVSFSNMANNTNAIFIPAFVSSDKSHFVHAVVHAFTW